MTDATEKESLDLKISKFSLFIDESIDRGSIKLLSVVRYYKNKTIKDAHLGLVPVQDATGEKLHEYLVTLFTDHDIIKIIWSGFAAYGIPI